MRALHRAVLSACAIAASRRQKNGTAASLWNGHFISSHLHLFSTISPFFLCTFAALRDTHFLRNLRQALPPRQRKGLAGRKKEENFTTLFSIYFIDY